jgi:hypothetical protein
MRDTVTIRDGRVVGCTDHFQPRQDAKSCETCGNTDFSDMGCIFSPSQCYPSKGNTSHWTPIVQPRQDAAQDVDGGGNYFNPDPAPAKSCETCGNGPDHDYRPGADHCSGCINYSHWFAPAPAADERVVRAEPVERGKSILKEYEHGLVGTATCVSVIRDLLAVVEEMKEHLGGDKRRMYGIIKNLEQERDAADVTLAEVREDRDLRIVALDKMKQQRDTACIHRADSQDRVKELEAEVSGQLVTAKELDDARCARIAELEAELKSEKNEHAEWQGHSDRWKEIYQKECEKRQDDLVQRGRQVKGWVDDHTLRMLSDKTFKGYCEISGTRTSGNTIPVTLTIEKEDK